MSKTKPKLSPRSDESPVEFVERLGLYRGLQEARDLFESGELGEALFDFHFDPERDVVRWIDYDHEPADRELRYSTFVGEGLRELVASLIIDFRRELLKRTSQAERQVLFNYHVQLFSEVIERCETLICETDASSRPDILRAAIARAKQAVFQIGARVGASPEPSEVPPATSSQDEATVPPTPHTQPESDKRRHYSDNEVQWSIETWVRLKIEKAGGGVGARYEAFVEAYLDRFTLSPGHSNDGAPSKKTLKTWVDRSGYSW